MIGWYPARDPHLMDALEKVSIERHADVIALRYQKHPPWYRLLHENPLKEGIKNGKMPLLIYSENLQSHE
jgi:hypothetical protein